MPSSEDPLHRTQQLSSPPPRESASLGGCADDIPSKRTQESHDSGALHAVLFSITRSSEGSR